MRILIIIMTTFLFCVSCGVKDDPKYQTQNNCNEKINII